MNARTSQPTRKGRRKWLWTALVIVAAILVIFSGVFLYLLNYKNVFVMIKGTKVSNSEMYFEATQQAEKLNYLGFNPLSSDPAQQNVYNMIMDYAKQMVVAQRLYYLMGIQDGYAATDQEIEKAYQDYKTKVTKGSTDPEQTFKDSLKTSELTDSQLRNILKEQIIAGKEEDKLTSNINLTEADIRAYFDEWASGYGANGKNNDQIYKEKYDQIKADAISMKKSDYIDSNSKNLIQQNIKEIDTDNVYKKFMRWVYNDFLGQSVPTEYVPEESL
jgi:hypothetical protein